MPKEKEPASIRDVHIIRRVDDDPVLREMLIAAFDAADHVTASRFAMLLAQHVVDMADIPREGPVEDAFLSNASWQAGETGFHEARRAAFAIHRLAREECDPVKQKALRALGQAAATPHVKRHALIAADYAVKVVNLLHPGDVEAVRAERVLQLELLGRL